MKTIQPIQLWNEGVIEDATIFEMYISYDDLQSLATFYYTLYNNSFDSLATGKIQMTSEQYESWDNSNDGAYNFGATTLNLKITGEYIPVVSDGTEDI